MKGKSKTRGERTAPLKSSAQFRARWILIAIAVVLIDQFTKIVISRFMTHGMSIPLGEYFNLVRWHNAGAAFSFLADAAGWQRWFFIGFSLIAILWILWMLFRHAQQTVFCFGLALILGGALGNLIDRSIYGHVIDFLDFHYGDWHYPAFNIADSAITGGVIVLLIDEVVRIQRHR